MFIDISGKLGLTPPYGREEKGSSLLSLLDDYVIVEYKKFIETYNALQMAEGKPENTISVDD